MNRGRTSIVVAAMAALAFTTVGRADDKGKDKDKAVQNATVHFAMPQPQFPASGTPGTPDNSASINVSRVDFCSACRTRGPRT